MSQEVWTAKQYQRWGKTALEPSRQGQREQIVIGIDPGVKTGVAVKQGGSLVEVCSMRIDEAMDFVKEYISRAKSKDMLLLVIFEDARQRKWFGKAGREKLQGAGSIKRDCKIWEDYLTSLEVPFRMAAPKKGATKHDAKTFGRLTGWNKRTNEHARDAAMLIL